MRLFLYGTLGGQKMEEKKREVLDMRGDNISKLNVKRGEDLVEL